MATIAYTTTRAATQSIALGTSSSGAAGGYTPLATADDAAALITQQPMPSRREMRAEALRAAVASGSLPASALDDFDDDDDGAAADDERTATKYNYSLFHVIFLGATMWVASLLTQNLDPEASGDGLAPVGRTYWASWVKIISAWVCYAIYAWTLVAPVLLPDRFEVY
ncbi:hypothetical protein KEM52_001455 [Ascosphaera acerosa]|nr:hypothetical protein KEM52_001455 [Ascosphaera acerosa]